MSRRRAAVGAPATPRLWLLLLAAAALAAASALPARGDAKSVLQPEAPGAPEAPARQSVSDGGHRRIALAILNGTPNGTGASFLSTRQRRRLRERIEGIDRFANVEAKWFLGDDSLSCMDVCGSYGFYCTSFSADHMRDAAWSKSGMEKHLGKHVFHEFCNNKCFGSRAVEYAPFFDTTREGCIATRPTRAPITTCESMEPRVQRLCYCERSCGGPVGSHWIVEREDLFKRLVAELEPSGGWNVGLAQKNSSSERVNETFEEHNGTNEDEEEAEEEEEADAETEEGATPRALVRHEQRSEGSDRDH